MTKVTFKSRSIISFITLVFGFVMAFNVHAQQKAPDLVVKDTVDAIVANIQENRELYKKDTNALYTMVEDTLVPSLHVTRMAKLILGKKYAKTSSEQQINEFASEFQTFIMRVFAPALLEYTGNEQITYEPINLQPGEDRVKVRGSLVAANGQAHSVVLSMSNRKDTQWRAYNIEAAGINFISTYRSTFEPTLKKKGIDGLIADLREKNAE